MNQEKLIRLIREAIDGFRAVEQILEADDEKMKPCTKAAMCMKIALQAKQALEEELTELLELLEAKERKEETELESED